MEDWRLDDDGELDDVVVSGDLIRLLHLERMDANAWWLGLTLKDGREVHLDFVTDGASLRVTRRED